jgi:hypothetical protein
MKGLRSLYILVLILLSATAFGQTATIKGRVIDEAGKPVTGAIVYVDNKPLASTGVDGTYTLQTLPGELTVSFRFIGYKEVSIVRNVAVGDVAVVDMRLTTKAIETGTANVYGTKGADKGIVSIDPRVVSRIATPGGTVEDIIKSLQGVAANNELSSQYSVRGGSYDENLIYINDIEVYRPFLVRSGQQEGLSFINPDMVSGINFSAGGFEARYGDKMSSVLDIQYRRPTRFGGSASASILGFSGQLEGTLFKNRFTFLVGGRQRTTQYLLNSLDTKGNYRPSAADIQGQFTFDFTENLQLQYLGSYSQNKYRVVPTNRETTFGTLNEALRLQIYFDGQETNSFDTYMSAFSLVWRANKNWLMKFITSGFKSTEVENSDILGQYYLNDVETDFGSDDFGQTSALLGVGSFLTHNRNTLQSYIYNVEHKSYLTINKHHMVYGIKWQHEEFNDKLSEWRYIDSADFSVPSGNDDIIKLQDVLKTNISLSSNRFMGYVQDSYNDTTAKGHIWSATAGVRANYWSVNQQLVVSPRVQLSLTPKWKVDTVYRANRKTGIMDTIIHPKTWQFRLAGGFYYQPPFYRELRNLQGQLNTGIRAQRSIHIIAGTDHYFTAWKRDFKLSVEAYYKFLHDLIPYEIDNVRIRYYAQNLSTGYATGIDARVNGEFVKGVESWMSLSIMKTGENLKNDVYYDRFDINGNKIIPGFSADQTAVDSIAHYPGMVPRPQDQRVTFSMFFQDHLPKWPTFKMSLTLTFGTGFPFGPPDFNRYKDSLRMPFYRRVDIGFQKQLISDKTKFREKSMFRYFKNMFISLEVFNLLGVNNTVSYLWIKDFSGRQYAIPNYLTNRLINIRLYAQF